MLNKINDIRKQIDLIHNEQETFYLGYITPDQWLRNANEIDSLVKKLDKLDKIGKIGLYVISGGEHNVI